ncbi:hypothetical protein BDN72DRAFT_881200 [Pluteus cervinus]|uniref:Uncharacterized protein n=1 Tax=Pluteus cervinus TaxID=181527 RepID=A0ACD3AGX1_9AGAR|nr:hypothetical protein BDN72DRAFT_881200 [Pluteus cervinus]
MGAPSPRKVPEAEHAPPSFQHLGTFDGGGRIEVSKEQRTVFFAFNDWNVVVGPGGIQLGPRQRGRNITSSCSAEFEQVHLIEQLVLENQRLQEKCEQLDHRIEDLEAKNSDLEKALVKKERKIGRKQGKIDCLEEHLKEARETIKKLHRMVGPLLRRKLLDDARKIILLENCSATYKSMVQEHIDQGGNPHDRDFFREICDIFRLDLRESKHKGELDGFLRGIHSAVRKGFPLNLAVVKMACNRDHFIRRQGNQAAHEFSAAEINEYLYVEKDGLPKKSMKTLRKVFHLVYPNGMEMETSSSTSTDVENEWATGYPFGLLSCIDI